MAGRRGFRWATGLLVALLGFQLGCGTLLYPERRGQTRGRLDADVVILDGIGLLFFVLPGLFAFAVDFVTGAVYLPQGEASRIGQLFGANPPDKLPPHVRDEVALAAWLEEQLGEGFDLDAAEVIRGTRVDAQRVEELVSDLDRSARAGARASGA